MRILRIKTKAGTTHETIEAHHELNSENKQHQLPLGNIIMMNWNQLLSGKRFGMENSNYERRDDRTDFQRDYDRLIFSSPFRRLQNKTQVFPLPGSIFVHNRLTHSLEVSCVGRSLGNNVGAALLKKYAHEPWASIFQNCDSIVSAASLAHDLGNPPFGHSGETAIASYFMEGKGSELKEEMTEAEWNDLTHFDGNANAFRLLTHQFEGRRKGGFVLTYSTLASIVKYPFSSSLATKQKFGFFTTEEDSFSQIAHELGLIRHSHEPLSFCRHPFVYLVEAADDICYQIMDIEDSCKLKLLTLEETCDLLLGYFTEERQVHMRAVMKEIADTNEQIAYLRSSVIGVLIEDCTRVFLENEETILRGETVKPLIDGIQPLLHHAYERCTKVAYDKIYACSDVLDIEVAGYQIIATLLDRLITAARYPERAYSKRLLKRVPEQYALSAPTTYGKVQAVLDYISGMTDIYALDLFRKINGMSLPAL